jgi:hypothetical protein
MDTEQLSTLELLKLHAAISEQLRERKIMRSANNPTGDLAEHLFCAAFSWQQAPNSSANVDAIDNSGLRYQIKGRRITRHNQSRQLGGIRNFAGRHFDYLAAVLFDGDYAVLRAALVPYAVVEQRARFTAHTNSHRFLLRDDVWAVDGVRDVTQELRNVTI